MKTYIITLLLLLTISSCGKIPIPSIIAPSENTNIQKVSFGDEPISYQNILKNYLIKNLKNYKTAKVEFINAPSKISIDHLGSNYSGYRVCLSINEKRGEHHIGYKNHFFLINNNEVKLHLFDSGLLIIPFEYCVSRNINKEIFIDDIPEKAEQISVESMDSIKLTTKNKIKYKELETELKKLREENKELKKMEKGLIESDDKSIEDLAKIEAPQVVYDDKDNLYIACTFDKKDLTYIFNANKETFKLINKLDIVTYAVNFNDAYIVATNEAIELTINRVTGKATLENQMLQNGICKLTNKTKF